MTSDADLRQAPTAPILRPGELRFAALHADHGHFYGMVDVLLATGAELAWIGDHEAPRAGELAKRHPTARAARSEDEALDDPTVKLIASAVVPNRRADLACRAMERGKDVFLDKPAFTTLAQLERVREVAARTGRRVWIWYGERLGSEVAVHATSLIARGAIGRVVQVLGLGPHRIGARRDPWFYDHASYGGILCDIASHQTEQFLAFTGSRTASVARAAVGNFANPQDPGLEDFGEASFVGERGESGYCRVDWMTPEGLGTWGDVRTIVIGTAGYLEMRKTIDLARSRSGDHLFLVDGKGQQHLELNGKVGCPFPYQLVRDCLDRTETAGTQAHHFLATELALKAQAMAVRLTAGPAPSSARPAPAPR